MYIYCIIIYEHIVQQVHNQTYQWHLEDILYYIILYYIILYYIILYYIILYYIFIFWACQGLLKNNIILYLI